MTRLCRFSTTWNIKHFRSSSQSFVLYIWASFVSSASRQKKSRNPLKHTKLFYDFPQDNVCSPVRLNLRSLCLELIKLCLRLLPDFKLFVVLLVLLELVVISNEKSGIFQGKPLLSRKTSSWSKKHCSRLKKVFPLKKFFQLKNIMPKYSISRMH